MVMIMTFLKTFFIFIAAGVCEIGGGYLIWLWMKEQKPLWYGVLGGIILAGYGVVAALQPANFARVYAAYGGIFMVMSLLWGWKVDQITPDYYDIIGAGVALVGMCIIFYAPRNL